MASEVNKENQKDMFNLLINDKTMSLTFNFNKR